MVKIPYDGVIEAIRTTADGQLELARAYEKRGLVFSDRILLTRADLIRRLKNGHKFMIGKRIPHMGGTFDTIGPIHLVKGSGGDQLSVSSSGTDQLDNLQDIPKF